MTHAWIVAVTAADTAEEWRNCLEAGMQDRPCKPYRRDDLVAGLALARRGLGLEEPSLRRALIVDDSAAHRLVLGHQLTALGVEVSMARDGLACLEALEAGPFDVVFLDWCMPGLDGPACRVGSRAPTHPGCPGRAVPLRR